LAKTVMQEMAITTSPSAIGRPVNSAIKPMIGGPAKKPK